MAAVDYEAVVLDLKAFIATKRSHSATEIREKLAEFEVNRRLPEGQELFDATPLPLSTTTKPALAASA